MKQLLQTSYWITSVLGMCSQLSTVWLPSLSLQKILVRKLISCFVSTYVT